MFPDGSHFFALHSQEALGFKAAEETSQLRFLTSGDSRIGFSKNSFGLRSGSGEGSGSRGRWGSRGRLQSVPLLALHQGRCQTHGPQVDWTLNGELIARSILHYTKLNSSINNFRVLFQNCEISFIWQWTTGKTYIFISFAVIMQQDNTSYINYIYNN